VRPRDRGRSASPAPVAAAALGIGPDVARSLAYAYLPSEHAAPGTPVSVEIFGEWIDGEVTAEPLWDPERSQIRM
jgi:4-methylaminobutanoate oxidase (formaldehyde-forming)